MDPYIGEIRLFAGDFAPQGWFLCNGSSVPISGYTPLYAVIGTTYGGDGKTYFQLPNLQGRAVMGAGAGPGLTPRSLGAVVGSETETLLVNQIPAHSHIPQGSTGVNGSNDPTGKVWGSIAPLNNPKPYTAASVDQSMNPMALSPAGANQPHNNMQPYLTLNYIICWSGVFPPKDN